MCSYNEFVEAYNNPNITSHDVRRIKNLNSKQFSRLRETAIRNGDISPVRHMNSHGAKFYTRMGNGFVVQKTFNGKKMIVGRFPNENTAKMVVDACIRNNWKLDNIKSLIEDLSVKPKNYSLVNGYWVIQKSVNGCNVVFNIFNSRFVDECTVSDIVDFYRENDWDYSLKDEVYNLFDVNF